LGHKEKWLVTPALGGGDLRDYIPNHEFSHAEAPFLGSSGRVYCFFTRRDQLRAQFLATEKPTRARWPAAATTFVIEIDEKNWISIRREKRPDPPNCLLCVWFFGSASRDRLHFLQRATRAVENHAPL
jgi:hypothetical protein